MSNQMDQLTGLLSSIVEGNTFTVGALDRMKAAIGKAEQLEKDLTRTQADLRRSTAALLESQAALAEANSKLVGWQRREEELIKRERAIFDLEKGAAVSTARADVYDRCFGLVFKNPEVKRSIYEHSSVPFVNNGFTTQATSTRSITDTQTTE